MLTTRAGIPRFASTAYAGTPATVVAFGTSITLSGSYLEDVQSELQAATGNTEIRLITHGMRGFTTGHALFRVADRVLPYTPDLLLLEFAHNDVTGASIDTIEAALHSIVAQVRAHNPRCEFIFVYLAMQGQARNGPTRAMVEYEKVARYFGFPSIDLASFMEQAVAEGTVGWDEGALPALTFDGVHHTAAAAALLAPAFASSLCALMLDSRGQQERASPPSQASELAHVARIAVAGLLVAGPWTIGQPSNHAGRNAEAYDEVVGQAQVVDAGLRVTFEGSQLLVWALGSGTLRVVVDGAGLGWEIPVTSGSNWNLYSLAGGLPDGRHTVDVSVSELPMILGDFFLIGTQAT